jgi:ABC-type uncharacterized transport system substrate-binding protein
MTYEYSIGGKWLQLLKDIAPRLTRAAVTRDSLDGAGLGLYGAIQSMASPLGVELTPVNIRNTTEMERTIAALPSANSGLVIPGSAFAIVHRNLIVTLAAHYKVPAVYWDRAAVTADGLMSYGPDFLELYRQAAGYVDRILKGEKPADLENQIRGLLKNIGLVIGRAKFNGFAARAEELIEDHPQLVAAEARTKELVENLPDLSGTAAHCPAGNSRAV